jgi:translation initiation factor 5B
MVDWRSEKEALSTCSARTQVDRLFDWQSEKDAPIRDALARQPPHVAAEFERRLAASILNLNEQGLNVALYWKNPDPRKYVNIVPTSAISGEGIPDMLQLLVKLTQARAVQL